jgi:hypothetical protein
MDLNWKKPEFNGYILPSNGSEKEIVTLIISELIKNGSLTELQIRNLSTTIEPSMSSSWLFYSYSSTWIHPAGRLWYKIGNNWLPINGLKKFYDDIIRYDEYIIKKRTKLMKNWEYLVPVVGDLFMEDLLSNMSMVIKVEEYAKSFPQGGWKIYLTNEMFIVTVPTIKAWYHKYGNIKYGDPSVWKVK